MNYKGEIIGAIITIGVAVITGIFTVHQTYRGEVKKSIHEEREKLYVELLAILDKLQRNPSIIYNFTEFISTYKQIYARSNLYASGKVMHIIQPFNEKLNEYWNLHEKFYSDEQLEKEIQIRLYEDEQAGIYRERYEIEDLIYKEEEVFISNNQMPVVEIQKLMNKMSSQIKKELMLK